jgi:DNA-binding protein
MDEMNRNKIVYSISVEDIQTVSEEVYGWKLSDEEIKTIIDPIGDRIE